MKSIDKVNHHIGLGILLALFILFFFALKK
jgi:hypothetical protein